jgi:CHAT domain-containing protein
MDRHLFLLGALLCACIPVAAQRGPVSGPSADDRTVRTPHDPQLLLQEAAQTLEAYRLHFRQTGDLSSMVPDVERARSNAQTAYARFLERQNYAKAAHSLVIMADVDRMLTMRSPADYQAKQAPAMQKYADALKLAEQANDAAMQFKALFGLSRTEMNIKDYVAASDHISKVIDLASRSGNKDDLFNAYEMKAEMETNRGNLSAAADYLTRALALSGELKDPSLLWYAYADRASIFNTRADECDFDRAYDFCKKVFDMGLEDTRQALQVARRQGWGHLMRQSETVLGDRKLLAEKRAEMAEYRRLAGSDSYITKASQVLRASRFAGGKNPTFAAQLRDYEKQQLNRPVSAYDPMKYHVEGALEEYEGNDDGALQNYLHAVRLLESDRRKLGDVQGSSSFLSGRIEIYYAAALQYLDRKQYGQAFEVIERSRSRAMVELLASRKLSFSTPELQDLFSQSVELKAQVGEAQKRLLDASPGVKADSDEIKDLQAKVSVLEAENRALDATIQQRAPKLGDLGDKPPVSLESAQAAARQGKYDILYYLTLRSGTVIWHIGGDSVHVVKVFYSNSQVADRVAALRKSLSDAHASFDERGATELFLALVNPVLPYVSTRHLVIVPHEDLSNLPFQVLKNPEDGSYLGERLQISYAPSATVLAGLSHRPDFAHGRLLALADPGITNAVAEVNAIGHLFPGRAKIVTDALASKQSLKSWTGDYNLIHLSVHGMFGVNNPLLSYLELHPAQSEDGHLTAAEMFGLKLPENSLVVLSACDTGRVEATHANEVLGMMRGLLFAGASTLVLSSWQVDAKSTAVWMETFYREARTKPPSEAAQLALVAVKEQPAFKHPFYWAPFLVTGQ